jgi:hypothetical protein
MKTIALLSYMALTNAQGPVDVVRTPTVSKFPHTQSPHPIVATLYHYPEEVGWKITGLTDQAKGIECKKISYTGHFGEQPAEDCPLK